MDDASPPKWHLAHTTWFFETFVLKAFVAGYRPFHPRYEYLFNSYYNGVGQPYPRARRGALSRPTVAEIYDYRHHVDEAMAPLLGAEDPAILERLTLGVHHEQQHQELLVTDIKYNLGNNPLLPAYATDLRDYKETSGEPPRLTFTDHPGGIASVGAGEGFCFDNEQPRHQVLLRPFALADRLITNKEFLEFMLDGGYENPELWLSEGWARIRSPASVHSAPGARLSPLYWYPHEDGWHEYRLSGAAPLVPDAPVVHVSYYEADAFARWHGCRLPTEQEWEHAAADRPVTGNFADGAALHPLPAAAASGFAGPASPAGPSQMFGDVWEWTASPYVAYPGYRPLPGTLGEYNGKFMSNQMVLRGGSCATPAEHVRPSYRNFFYPPDKWQFSGIRLARDL
jgi:ergothioneine biosynthesis protein EgtB